MTSSPGSQAARTRCRPTRCRLRRPTARRPGGRPSLPSATARTSALVIIPSRWSNSASGRPQRNPGRGRRGAAGSWPERREAPTRPTSDRTNRSARPSSVDAIDRLVGLADAGHHRRRRRRRRADRPTAAPTHCGGVSGEVSTATFAGVASASSDRRRRGVEGSRPWAETTAASSQDRPSRANAMDTDDGAGWTTSASGPKRCPRDRTIPKKPGIAGRQDVTRRPDAPSLGDHVEERSSGPRERDALGGVGHRAGHEVELPREPTTTSACGQRRARPGRTCARRRGRRRSRSDRAHPDHSACRGTSGRRSAS